MPRVHAKVVSHHSIIKSVWILIRIQITRPEIHRWLVMPSGDCQWSARGEVCSAQHNLFVDLLQCLYFNILSIITSTVYNFFPLSLRAQNLSQFLPTIDCWYLICGLPLQSIDSWHYAHRFVLFSYHYFFWFLTSCGRLSMGRLSWLSVYFLDCTLNTCISYLIVSYRFLNIVGNSRYH